MIALVASTHVLAPTRTRVLSLSRRFPQFAHNIHARAHACTRKQIRQIRGGGQTYSRARRRARARARGIIRRGLEPY